MIAANIVIVRTLKLGSICMVYLYLAFLLPGTRHDEFRGELDGHETRLHSCLQHFGRHRLNKFIA